MQEQGRRVPRLSPAAQIGVAVALALFAVYCLVVSFQLAEYVEQADALEKRLITASAALQAIEMEFVASPAVAEKIASGLDTQAETIGTIEKDIQSLAPPLLAPYSAAADQKRALTAHVQALSDQLQQLSVSAEYVNRRGAIFGDVEKALSGLGELAEKTSIAGVRKVVSGVRSDLEAATDRLRSETASSPVLYSNAHLLWRLSELSKRLGDVEEAVSSEKVKRIEARLEEYAQFVNSDWGISLVSHDRRGLQSLEAVSSEIDEAAQAAEDASVAASTAQYALIGLALLALVGAAFMGFNLALRDRDS